MKKMLRWALGALLAVNLTAAADRPDPLRDALNGATPGSVFPLPATLPAGWHAHSVKVGAQTPDFETWARDVAFGRVLWAYRPGLTQKVAATKVEGETLHFWSPIHLMGIGWQVSDRLPEVGPPAPSAPPKEKPAEPAAPVAPAPVPAAGPDVVAFAAAVENGTVGDVIPNAPTACPDGWAELKLHSPVGRWPASTVGALYCEAEKRRTPFFVSAVGEEPEGKVTTVWMRQADVDRLTGRSWVAVKRTAETVAPADSPAPAGENGQAEIKPPVGAAAESDKPVEGQPLVQSPALSKDWLRPGGLDQRKPGDVVDVTGLDRYLWPTGWQSGAIADPGPELQKPGLVIIRPEGLAVIVHYSPAPKAAPGHMTHAITTYWCRKTDRQEAVALPTPGGLQVMAVGTKVVLPAGTTWKASPDGWHRVQLRPFSRAVSLALPPGTVVELVRGEQSIRSVVVEWVYDEAEPEEWTVRLWAAAKPEQGYKLRLPPGL